MSADRPLDPLPSPLIAELVDRALLEDLGLAGDITTEATIPDTSTSRAAIRARTTGVVAGLALAEEAFFQVDEDIRFEATANDGDRVAAGAALAEVSGPARGILTGERTALNFVGHLSGIATLTARFVEQARGTGAKIVCTRKTTPGLRAAEKYAVRAGGGMNHRFGLYDAVLIKDNHIAAAGGIVHAIRAAKARAGHMVKIEIEVDTLDQLDLAVDEGCDVVMLDNMPPDMMREAVRKVPGHIITEASGGVSLETVRAIAETGVDLISVGALTHSAPSLDVGLDFLD
ncbi:MAG: carboxylating nicotinate-nucleotide diphosphorylase [Pseudomonadota bacterium]